MKRLAYERCPLCGYGISEILLTADCSGHPLFVEGLPPTMTWLECEKCEHVYVQRYLDHEALQAVAQRALPHHLYDNAGQIEQARHLAADLIDWVLSLNAAHNVGKRWLDVGFGNGNLLTTLKEYGFEPEGIEQRQASVDAMKEAGIEVGQGDFSGALDSDSWLSGSKPYDVVSMLDVLEHFSHPKQALVTARDCLTRGGILLVTTPNLDCYPWYKLAPESNPYWKEFEHCHIFSRARLEALLSELGFDPGPFAVSRRYRMGMQLIASKR